MTENENDAQIGLETLKKDYIHHQKANAENVQTSLRLERNIISILKQSGYDFGVTHPCSLLKDLLILLEEEKGMQVVPVTREEEGVGICTGAYLAGKKPFMLIQSSGLGNSFNAMASLLMTYKIPLLILASYRGYYKEKIPAHIPLGRSLLGMLDAMRVPFAVLNEGVDGLVPFIERESLGETPYVAFMSPEMFEDA